jgi:hypothetical protein
MSKHHKHHHHHSEKSSHRHHHSTSVTSVDWKKQRLYHDGEKYTYESFGNGLTPCKWWRIGRSGMHIVTSAGEISDLDEVLLRQSQKKVLADEGKIFTAQEASASCEEDRSASSHDRKLSPWQKHTKAGPPAKGKRIERTKYGVRIWNVEGTTYWDFCVNDSTKHPGNAAVRLTLPPPRKDGKQFQMGIFDLEAMEAIRRELARGPQPKR